MQLDVTGLRAAWSADLGFATVDPEVAAEWQRRWEAARAAVYDSDAPYPAEPIEVVSTDEVGRLATTMNEMRAGLFQRDQQLQLMNVKSAHGFFAVGPPGEPAFRQPFLAKPESMAVIYENF